MHPAKLEFMRDVMNVIHELSKLVFNLKTDSEVEKVFGATSGQLDMILSKIIQALPDEIFNKMSPHIFKEIEKIFAKEFIFFQVQEKLDDPEYERDLKVFIDNFSRDIQRNLKHWREEQLK